MYCCKVHVVLIVKRLSERRNDPDSSTVERRCSINCFYGDEAKHALGSIRTGLGSSHIGTYSYSDQILAQCIIMTSARVSCAACDYIKSVHDYNRECVIIIESERLYNPNTII